MQSTDTETLRVLRFQANNILRLSVVDITPDKDVMVIGGRNAQGKSSILNSIMAAVGGAKNRPKELLKKGQKKGTVTLEIGDTEPKYILTLTVTPEGERITLTTAEGAKFNGCQGILDGWYSAVAFDPLDFLRMKKADQLNALKELVGLDFTELDTKRKELFDQRTEVNREVKAAKTNFDQIDPVPDLPKEEVSIEALNKELQEANGANLSNATRRNGLAAIQTRGEQSAGAVRASTVEITRLENLLTQERTKLEGLTKQTEAIRAEYATAKADIAKLQDIDTAPIIERINGIQETNRKVRKNKERDTWQMQLTERADAAAELTLQIEAIDKKKADQLTAAAFPVPGLSFDETDVLYQGLPIEQASSREKIHVAAGIALANHPKLNVMLCREGSMLDEDGMEQIKELAAKHGCQIWLEVVGNRADASVIIEDGAVKEAE